MRPQQLASPLSPYLAMRQIPLTRNGITLEILSEDQALDRLASQKNLIAIRSKRKSRRLKELRVTGCEPLRPMWQDSRGRAEEQDLGNGLRCWTLTGTPGCESVPPPKSDPFAVRAAESM